MPENICTNTKFEIAIEFFAMPLDGMDMVLGTKWFIQWGTCGINLEE